MYKSKEDIVLDALRSAKKGDVINPAIFEMEYEIPTKKMYALMEGYAEKHKMTNLLEVKCPRCKDYVGLVQCAFWSLPEQVSCPRCGFFTDDFKTIYENTVVLYRKEEDTEDDDTAGFSRKAV